MHRQSEFLQNAILGGQDGLVNVLGLSIGVAGATGSRELVLVSGIAAMLAESISMGAVAYTVGRTAVKIDRKSRSDAEFSDADEERLIASGKTAGIPARKLELVRHLLSFHRKDERRAPIERGALVWFSTMCGSFIPLAPYVFTGVSEALPLSLAFGLAALFITGAIRARHTGEKWFESGAEMALVGLLATVAGYAIGSVLKVTV